MNHYPRRHILRQAAALPLLGSLPYPQASNDTPAARAPLRLIFMHYPLGCYGAEWFQAGDRDTGSELGKLQGPLSSLDPWREWISLIDGVSLIANNSTGHHGAGELFLTAGKTSSTSFDQLLAYDARLGGATRHRALHISGHTNPSQILAFDPQGTPVPPVTDPRQLYDQLFGDDDLSLAALRARNDQRRSILTALRERNTTLQHGASPQDHQKLAEYDRSIAEIEGLMARSERWKATPKPKPDITRPATDIPGPNLHDHVTGYAQLIAAAFQTDQTRIVTYGLHALSMRTTDGRVTQKHPFTHHGNDPVNIRELIHSDAMLAGAFAQLLTILKNSPDSDGRSLLDNTVICFGSACGDANAHQGKRIPLILAGARDRLRTGHGFQFPFGRHGIGDVFRTMATAIDCPVDAFARSVGPITSLLQRA